MTRMRKIQREPQLAQANVVMRVLISPFDHSLLQRNKSTMKIVAAFVATLSVASAFAPQSAGRSSTQLQESLADKVCVYL